MTLGTFHGQSIAITGGTGSFGMAFARHLLTHYDPARVILYSRDEVKHDKARTALNDPRVRCFVGDVLFAGSIGRTDFPGGDYDTLIRSITQELWPLGDDIQFVPGHGPMSSFGQERRTNPFVSDAVLAGATKLRTV